MFMNIDKVIEESNKKMLYGEKPKVPDILEPTQEITKDGNLLSVREPTARKIREKINEIIKYLEWLDK